MHNKNTFTYGYEIEWGDIRRDIKIPQQLGTWDNSETDILNLNAPHMYIAADPLGIAPPVGGEINTKPTIGWRGQVERIMEIHDLFVANGCKPTSASVNEGHIHVHIPGLTQDLSALKRLIQYIKDNQVDTVNATTGFVEHPDMKEYKGAKMYLKYDIGRLMPNYMCDNIINLAQDFPSFIKLHAAGKDGVSMGRPFRYAINTYCLKHTTTIEFRSTTNIFELKNAFLFVEQFMDAALNTGKPVKQILDEYMFRFPKFYWSAAEYACWIATKYPKERGKKIRNYYEIV